ncbi:MAG: translation initiation factor 2 [Pseudomonadota bacterium]
MRRSSVCVLCALLPLVASCASSNRNENERFHIQSEPETALAKLSTGESCLTPCHFDLPRSSEFRVTLTKDGYRPYTTTIRSVKSQTGGRPATASVSVGGIFNVPVGPQTGVSYDLEPNPLIVELERR